MVFSIFDFMITLNVIVQKNPDFPLEVTLLSLLQDFSEKVILQYPKFLDFIFPVGTFLSCDDQLESKIN